uniref:B30.2/SPRY domain-containing protein n=1 Tax=Periophthalmus magnuspinnatus TaxID=409849 RepID=A0A3B3ZVK2_9GOBI
MTLLQEALRRIIITLTNKNQELKDFLRTLEWTRTGLQVSTLLFLLSPPLSSSSLPLSLPPLSYPLFSLLSYSFLLFQLFSFLPSSSSSLSPPPLLLSLLSSSFSSFLSSSRSPLFFPLLYSSLLLSVTMASAFRITTRPLTSPDMSQFAVDFSAERAGLHRLDFLPVPSAPRLDVCRCFVRDNSVFLQWSAVDQSGASYELQYRKCDSEATPPAAEACWEKIQGIRDTHSAISGQSSTLHISKAALVGGSWSRSWSRSWSNVSFCISGFDFGLDSDSAHPELTVERHSATWGSKGKGAPSLSLFSSQFSLSLCPHSGTVSPVKSSSGRGSRERFAGESYTVLGENQELSGGGHYWEVRPMGDWKCVSVGVAYRGALSRFVRLGKSPASWSLSLSQWLQPSVSAKHNNKSKNLHPSVPARVGVYCHYGNGDLLFIDVEQMRLIHSFRTKFNQSLVPAFSVIFTMVIPCAASRWSPACSSEWH